MFGKKIVKRCPKGHEMELDWRRCPKCTGRSALHEGRDITEATVILGPGSSPADETRIVLPSLAGSRAGAAPAAAPPAGGTSPPRPAPAASAASWPGYAPEAARPAPPPPPPPPASVKLNCTGGPLEGRTFALEMGVTRIGKAPPEGGGMRAIAIPADRFLSKEHAVLTVGTAQVVLSDPGSTNGTFVNGERITRVILKDGDEIRVGESFFRLAAGR